MAVKIEKVKGDEQAAKRIEEMESLGWTLDNMDSRKEKWNPWMGVFANKSIHHLTFRKAD
jgi:hypothetical protein